MAIATAKTAPPRPPILLGVDLQLTHEEAIVLADVFGTIGGSPTLSRRGIIDKINKALRGAGYAYDKVFDGPAIGNPGNRARKDYDGTIFFK